MAKSHIEKHISFRSMVSQIPFRTTIDSYTLKLFWTDLIIFCPEYGNIKLRTNVLILYLRKQQIIEKSKSLKDDRQLKTFFFS